MGKSVFFIDDDHTFLFVVKNVCKKIEAIDHLNTANNGQEALDKVQSWLDAGEQLPDIMFVDINMPVMDGITFLAKFKELKVQNSSLEQIKVVSVLTSSDQESDKNKIMDLGVTDAYTIKPKGMDELINIVSSFVK